MRLSPLQKFHMTCCKITCEIYVITCEIHVIICEIFVTTSEFM